MITVHHLSQSRSYRILWLLEELELPYEVVYYRRDKSLLAPESLKRIHPLGKAPIISDGEFVLAESGAIIDYLEAHYDPAHLFSPEDPLDDSWIRYRYWLQYAEGSLMPLLLLKLVFSRLNQAPVPWLVRPIGSAVNKRVSQMFITPQLALHCRYIDEHLSKSPWFAGERFTAADIQMSLPLDLMDARVNITGYPALRAYLDKVRLRPAYLRAKKREQQLEKGK